jgi:hypothetical protein
VHSLLKKVVAYRNDFCLTCNAPRIAIQTRSLKAIHIYSVPLVPLGFWREWHCQVCDQDPHRKPGTMPSRKWAAVLGLAMLAGVAWFDDEHNDAAIWTLRAVTSIAAIALAAYTIRNPPGAALREKLQQVTPADENICALCRGVLVRGEQSRCSQCGVERLLVNA